MTTDCLKWMEENPNAGTDELKREQKKLEEKYNPIMVRVYAATREPPNPQQPQPEKPSESAAPPDVEDLD